MNTGELETTDVVVLCGGKGTRLRSQIGKTQKVMATIDGHPFLDLVIANFKKQGFKRFILCTGYQADAVEEHYRKDNQGLIFEFSKEGKPLGTGGAVKNAQNLINSNPFLVLNGDCYCSADFSGFVRFQREQDASVLMVTSANADSKDYGSIVMDDSKRIVEFAEKAGSQGYVSVGAYCFSQEIFIQMPEKESFSLEYDVFPSLAKEGLYGFFVEEGFLDIGTPQRLKEAEALLKKEKKGEN